MSVTSSIAERLNLGEYAGQLLPVDGKGDSARLEFFRGQARLVGADHFYVVRNELEEALVPLIYVYDERGKSESGRKNLFEISKKVWTVGEVAAAIIIYDDELKIVDARRPPDGKNDAPALLGNLTSYSEIDRQLRSKLFEGRILEEAGDYVSFSPYEKLLKHIDKNILVKRKEIGCSEKTLKKLTVKLILAKYLEEQTDDNGTAIPINVCAYLKPNRAVELFDELNAHLNGGVFDLNEDERADIAKADLTHIANALDGSINPDGQREFWKIYDFNLIPIEFISRLYERFVISIKDDKKKTRKDGAYYTPPHLARLMVDDLLPFDLDVDFKNFKVLDPSCGSGIFLVLAYKRLITLWMLKNGKKKIEGRKDIQAIKSILNNCIYGVDINGDALAITATSLQIELTSHVQPKEIWPELKFDNLLKQGNLQEDGFFRWHKKQKGIVYDVILGNPPFNVDNKQDVIDGKDDALNLQRYPNFRGTNKSFPGNSPALTVLYQSLANLLNPSGKLFMVLPSSTMYNANDEAQKFKEVLYTNWQVERVYDFTPLRDTLWSGAAVATIALKVSHRKEFGLVSTEHVVVRQSHTNAMGALRFQVDKYDRFYVPTHDAVRNPYIWKANLLGGGRIRLYVEKYYLSPKTRIRDFIKDKDWLGQDGAKSTDSEGRDIRSMGVPLVINKAVKDDVLIDHMLDYSPTKKLRLDNEALYSPPHVLIKLNLNQNLPTIFNDSHPLLFEDSFFGIASSPKDAGLLIDFCEAFRSNRTLYKFLITVTSAKTFLQMAGNSLINSKDIKELPINLNELGEPIPFPSQSALEKAVLEDVEVMAECLNKTHGKLFNPVVKGELDRFSDAFCEILNHVYEKGEFKFRPVRQVIENELVWVTYEHSAVSQSLETTMSEDARIIFSRILADDVSNNGLRINRIITYYEEKNRVSFIKPNRLKYWTRSIGYRDAENVKGDMFNHGY
jgi:type I restriction-modification system DNA methylase subunit